MKRLKSRVNQPTMNLLSASGMLFLLATLVSTSRGLPLLSSHNCDVRCENCTRPSVTLDLKCGSDGVTYLNICELNCSRIHCNTQLNVLHDGLCVESLTATSEAGLRPTEQPLCDPFEDCNCSYDLLLVCGVDGDTYPNPCALQCATKCNHELKIAHYGACYK